MSERSRAGAAVVCLALASGCASVRGARLAQDPARAVPGERTPTAGEVGLPAAGALGVEDAVDAALRVHPSVVRARREAEAAAARVGEAEGAFLPSLSANASTQYRDREPGAEPSSREEHRFRSYGFQMSWLLFDFGRTPAQARQAAEQWLAAQADERAAEVDAAFGVRAAYANLLSQARLRDVARDAVAQFDEHLAQVREFVRVGSRIPFDETKAEVDAGNARLALVRTEDAVLAAQAALANAIGLAETTDWTASADGSSEAPPSFDACWEEARLHRPRLAAAAARERASSALVDARVASLYPSADVGLGWSTSGASSPLTWNWQAGPGLSWVPFDGFRNLYTIDEAAANLRAARAARTEEEQRAWFEVRSAWLGIEDARRRLEVTALVIRSSEENLRVAQGRFDVGKATAVELTDARQSLNQARADDVQARADLDLARARLAQAMGSTGRDGGAAAPGDDR